MEGLSQADLVVQALYTPSADHFWRRAGHFGAIAAWHPHVQACRRRGPKRSFNVPDGRWIHERLLPSKGPHQLRYTRGGGPFRYEAELTAHDDQPGLASVRWSVRLGAGPDDPELRAIACAGLREFFVAGLEAVGCESIE